LVEEEVDTLIEKESHPKAHPQALFNQSPNPEKLLKEVLDLSEKWQDESLSFEDKNLIKDQLRHLQTRCNWIQHQEHKVHIQHQIEALWKSMLQTL